MSLFGSKPKMRQATAGETALRQHADELRSSPAAQRMQGLRVMLGDSLLAGREGQRAAAMGGAAGTMAQQFRDPVTDSRDAVDQAVARGRGLSRVLGGTRQQFDNQLMRDRVSFVQRGRQRQGMGLQEMIGSAQRQDAFAAAQAGRRRVERGIRQEGAGALAGAGLRAWMEHRPVQTWRASRTPTPDVTQGVDVNLGNLGATRGLA